ncbi:hypothetical protein NLG97_g713 [Lecanicillium saksenae]|uniref:Uncharacterized protein n=1 Tax=Lecanicillium saksenae TaxID=468837 RepID=A0ACC1R5Y7_9HYPO|nr:hypothetical protein NLG97_g713 [Lecanicillium saksenae]
MTSAAETRQACDRCHGKKLKCIRQAQDPSCVRCAKASATCTFSPATRPTRLPQTGESTSSSSATASDWGNEWFSSYPALNQPIGSSLTGAGQDAEHGIAALPQVMGTLDAIWRGMPPPDACHISLEDMGQYLEYIAGATFIGSVLDQVLSAAQKLQKMYFHAIKDGTKATSDSNNTGCTTQNCVHLRPSGEPDSVNRADYTTLTLLTACHLRLLDILSSIAKHGKLCLEMANAVPPEERPQFLLPHMQMGSFVVPQEKMASMIITMLIDQQESLIKSTKQLGRYANCAEERTRASLGHMFAVQSEVLLEQATIVLNDFRAMGDIYSSVDLFGSRGQ